MLLKTEIIVHDSRDRSHLVYKGLLPSGGELISADLPDIVVIPDGVGVIITV